MHFERPISSAVSRSVLVIVAVFVVLAVPRAEARAHSCPRWQPRNTTGPSPRYGHAVAYDSARGVTVLFGRYDDNLGGDTWEHRSRMSADFDHDCDVDLVGFSLSC